MSLPGLSAPPRIRLSSDCHRTRTSYDRRALPKPYFIYAEDDPNSVVLLRAALRKAGAEDALVHAPDGDALITCLRDAIISGNLPAFVLLDIRMPRMGGFEALRWIRALPQFKELPIVILSSSPLPEDVELATALGATSYVTKPGPYEELCRTVADLLARFGVVK
jgi:two-component system response regulator